MRITCVSDLHGHYPALRGGDLLIVAGDLTASDRREQYFVFRDWLHRQKYRRKVVVAGNHDGCIQQGHFDCGWLSPGVDYLQDSGTEFEGIRIWGSPWTPTFFHWHFMLDRGEQIREKWELIPLDTDILVTHGPPYDVLDMPCGRDEKLGCRDLREVVKMVRPKMHVFGHIHGGYGSQVIRNGHRSTTCVNASIMNEGYEPVNKPVNIDFTL